MAKIYQNAKTKRSPRSTPPVPHFGLQAKVENPTATKAKTLKNAILLDLPALFSMPKVMASTSTRYSYGGIINKELTTERQLVLEDTWHIGSTGSMLKMRYGQWEEAEHAGTRTILPAFQIESIRRARESEARARSPRIA